MKSCQEERPAVRKELADSYAKGPLGLSCLPNLKGWHQQKCETISPFMKAKSRNVFRVQKQKIAFVKLDFLLLQKTP